MAIIIPSFISLTNISNCFLKSLSFGFFFVSFSFFFSLLSYSILSFFQVFLKFLLLFLFFFLNIFTFFLTIDISNFWVLFFDLFGGGSTLFSSICHFSGVLLVFWFDLFHFLFLNILLILNPKNFVGIFGYIGQFVTLYFMEGIFLMDEQSSVDIDLEEENYIYPTHLLGDNLERAFRFRKILDLFYFSDVFYEKTFVYRKVGLLNSRFWLFRHFHTLSTLDDIASAETLLRSEYGNFLEPDRWLLDFRDLRPADYLDPWHFFSNRYIFRTLDDFNVSPVYRTKKRRITVQLLHNYTSVMESEFEEPSERSFPVYDDVTTNVFAELLCFFVYSSLFLYAGYFFDALYYDAPQIEEIDRLALPGEQITEKSHPLYEGWYINENLESQLFSMQPMDIEEYSLDDDLSWDALLAQPDALRYSEPVGVSHPEFFRHNNYLFDEVRTFSFLYPLYKLMYKISPYKFADFFLFTDSGRCFKIIFRGLLYLPVGIMIVLFKCIVKFYDIISSFHVFFKFTIFLILLIFSVVFFI